MHIPTVCLETERETVKKLKARKKGEGNHWLFVRQTPDVVSTIVRSFPGVGGVPPSLSLQVRHRLTAMRLLQPGVHGVGTGTGAPAQSPHFRMMW